MSPSLKKRVSGLVAELERSDSEEQKEAFKNDPTGLDKYSRDVEGELNKRFTLVLPHTYTFLLFRHSLTTI